MDIPFIYDATGHVGYAFLLLGMVLLAMKNRWGWVCRFVGEVVWVILGFAMGFSAMWFWGLIFLGIEVYGFWNWSRRA
jgi:hypothetical protein